MKPSRHLKRYGSDKVIGHHYGDFYDELFSKYKEPFNLLEIGVFCGRSILAWRDAFPKSKITGIDNVQYFEYLKDDITFIYDDIKNVKLTEKYDIILDDSSHDLRESLYEIMNFTENLTENGIMVIEDIQIPPTYVSAMTAVLPKGFVLKEHDFRHYNGRHDDFIVTISRG